MIHKEKKSNPSSENLDVEDVAISHKAENFEIKSPKDFSRETNKNNSQSHKRRMFSGPKTYLIYLKKRKMIKNQLK